MILFDTPFLFLNFKTPCVTCSTNLDEISVCFKIFCCRLLLMRFFESKTKPKIRSHCSVCF